MVGKDIANLGFRVAPVLGNSLPGMTKSAEFTTGCEKRKAYCATWPSPALPHVAVAGFPPEAGTRTYAELSRGQAVGTVIIYGSRSGVKFAGQLPVSI